MTERELQKIEAKYVKATKNNPVLLKASINAMLCDDVPPMDDEDKKIFVRDVMPYIRYIAEKEGKRKEYPKFHWMPEWKHYTDTIPKEQTDRRLDMLDAIMIYGCYGVKYVVQTPEDKAYFEKEIIPELDRQHKLLDEGKEI